MYVQFPQIAVGRSTRDHSIDVDLSLEGPAAKVSRKQATIRLRNTGDFFMSSEGKRPIFVDGRPILQGNKVKLNHNSVIEVHQCYNHLQLPKLFRKGLEAITLLMRGSYT